LGLGKIAVSVQCLSLEAVYLGVVLLPLLLEVLQLFLESRISSDL
jgi:hypothetical protein